MSTSLRRSPVLRLTPFVTRRSERSFVDDEAEEGASMAQLGRLSTLDLAGQIALAPCMSVSVSAFDSNGAHQTWMRGRTAPGGAPVVCTTWWDLASLTKVLVTLPAIMQVASQDRSLLTMPLARIWRQTARRPLGEASIANLLSHSSGLPAHRPLYKTGLSPDEMVELILTGTELDYEPGASAVYSDLGYVLLGAFFLRESGKSIADYADTLPGFTSSPLPLKSVATEICSWRRRVIQGETHDENAAALGRIAGQAGVFGTAPGLIDCLLSELQCAARLSRDGFAHLAFRHWSSGFYGERYGLGWWLHPTRGLGGTLASSSGFGVSGFVGNRVWLEPKRGYGVLVLSNRTFPIRGDRSRFNSWCVDLIDSVHRHMLTS